MVIRLSPWTKHALSGLLLFVFGCYYSGCTLLIRPPTPVAPLAAPSDVRLIIQVVYPTVDRLNTLAGELDIWEVDRTAQTFVARVTLAQYAALLQQDVAVTLDCAKMRQYAQDVDLSHPRVSQLMQEQCADR